MNVNDERNASKYEKVTLRNRVFDMRVEPKERHITKTRKERL